MIDTTTRHHEHIAIEQWNHDPRFSAGRWIDCGYALAGDRALERAQEMSKIMKEAAKAEGQRSPRFRIVRVNTLHSIIEETS